MTDDLLTQYLKPQLHRDSLTPFLRMFAGREPWTDVAPDDALAKQKHLDEEMNKILGEVNRIYESQVKKFNNPRAALTEEEQQYGLLHPVAIVQHMLEKRDFSANERADLMEIVHKSYPTDHVTGYYTRHSLPTMTGLAHLFVKEEQSRVERGKSNPEGTQPAPAVPVCIIEGDFSNMGGCNKALEKVGGRQATDKLLRSICDIVKDSFSRENTGKKDGVLEVQPIRKGGDELQLIVYGLKKEVVDDILHTKVHPRINLLAARYGVHDISHTKLGKLPGFGAAFASAPLFEDTTPSMVNHQMEIGIARQKELDGLLRFGMVNEKAVDRYIEQIFIPQRKDELLRQYQEEGITSSRLINQKVAQEISGELKDERHKRIQQMRKVRLYWEELTGTGGIYHGLYQQYAKAQPGNADLPQGFFQFIADQHKWKRDANLATNKIPPRAPIEERIPFYNEKVIERDEDLETRRVRKALSRFGFTELANMNFDILKWNPETRQHSHDVMRRRDRDERSSLLHMVVDLMHFYDAHDPASFCKSDELMAEDARDFAKQHKGLKVMMIELGNLGGLNNVNYDLGNAALYEASLQIQKALRTSRGPGKRIEHVADHVYHSGGGKFWAFLNPEYRQEDADLAMQKLQDWMNGRHGAANKPVVRFAFDPYSPNYGRIANRESFEALNKRKLRTQTPGKVISEQDILQQIIHPRRDDLKDSLIDMGLEGRLGDTRRKRSTLKTKFEQLGLDTDNKKYMSQIKKMGPEAEAKLEEILGQTKMHDVPSLKDVGRFISINSYYNDKAVYAPDMDFEREFEKISEAAKQRFNQTDTPGNLGSVRRR